MFLLIFEGFMVDIMFFIWYYMFVVFNEVLYFYLEKIGFKFISLFDN